MILFRDFLVCFDLKVGTFLSFCLYFTKFDVGTSLGLDLLHFGHRLFFSELCLPFDFELTPRFSGFLFSVKAYRLVCFLTLSALLILFVVYLSCCGPCASAGSPILSS